jgi:hypothetical protein
MVGVIGTATGLACAIGTALAGSIVCAGAGLAFGMGITSSLDFVMYGDLVTS